MWASRIRTLLERSLALLGKISQQKRNRLPVQVTATSSISATLDILFRGRSTCTSPAQHLHVALMHAVATLSCRVESPRLRARLLLSACVAAILVSKPLAVDANVCSDTSCNPGYANVGGSSTLCTTDPIVHEEPGCQECCAKGE